MAESAVEELLKGTPSPEARLRAGVVLRAIGPPYRIFPSENVRRLRAMEVLERIGTADARRTLQSLSKSSTLPRERRKAKAILLRLSR